MAIKSVTSEGPPPSKVAIAHNASDKFLDAIITELKKDWGVIKVALVQNTLMPKNSAIIYDRYDQILVNEVNGQLYYKKITKEERNAAMVKNSGGVCRPIFPTPN